ncbi:adenylate kinase family protein [Salinigranum salinum]|uniref:adenylate kinase family protein n=1 Tax=Salinigranum salinum TaxID=1364937 RepID=UPI001261219F|nr:adenylate kinase family protein [Salinigranum salinum]
MRVVLTGTPGTGKTTAADRLPGTYEVVHLNEVVEREGLWTERDADRDSLVVDVDALAAWVDDHVDTPRAEAEDEDENDGSDADTVVLESHLAHLLDADRVIVLRCRPDVLESRLRERGLSEAKAAENAESEALDVILSEAVEHGAERVYEIDTTDRSPGEVATEIERVVTGERDPSAGEVDFTDYLHP